MRYKTCFFIGHREAPESFAKKLAEAVERHITEYKSIYSMKNKKLSFAKHKIYCQLYTLCDILYPV